MNATLVSIVLSVATAAGFTSEPPEARPAQPANQGDRPASPGAAAATVANLDSLIEAIRSEATLPGMAVAVVGSQGGTGAPRVLAVGKSGVREVGGSTAIGSDDLWHLGSCTKAFTATLCAVLVDQGKLRWESTVGEVLKADVQTIDAKWTDVTLEELLRHEGGAPKSPPPEVWKAAWLCSDEPERCRQRFVAAILGAPPAHARGTFEYSNQGYAIVGRMCEVAAGAAWEELVIRHVCEPLGITSAGFGVPSKRLPDRAPKGHAQNGSINDVDNPNAIAPAGTMHMTIEDWARFVAFHASPTPSAALPISQASFDRLHRPSTASSSGAALGWMVAQRAWGGTVLNHSGSNTVWFCTTWISPAKGFAVLVTTNQGGDAAARAADRAAGSAIEWWKKSVTQATSPAGAHLDQVERSAPAGGSPES